jgi:FkbM family methyltransferase
MAYSPRFLNQITFASPRLERFLASLHYRFLLPLIHKYFPPSDLLPFSLREIKRRVIFNPTGVVHVGAHLATEVPTYRNLGLKVIHLFEPQPFAIEKILSCYSSSNDIVIHDYALGSQCGYLPMFVEPGLYDSPNRSASSSLLAPAKHLQDYPHVKFSSSQSSEVKIVTLDSLNITNCDLLVVDTQGFDLEVLKGAANTLKHFKWIICEYWSNEAYVNACSLEEILCYLSNFGFKPVLQSYDRTCGDILLSRQDLIR